MINPVEKLEEKVSPKKGLFLIGYRLSSILGEETSAIGRENKS